MQKPTDFDKMLTFEDVENILQAWYSFRMFLHVAFIITITLLLTVVADYNRASQCDKAAYATVITAEPNMIGEFEWSRNYLVKFDKDGQTYSVNLDRQFNKYLVGDVIYIMYNDKIRIYRTPNIFY